MLPAKLAMIASGMAMIGVARQELRRDFVGPFHKIIVPLRPLALPPRQRPGGLVGDQADTLALGFRLDSLE